MHKDYFNIISAIWQNWILSWLHRMTNAMENLPKVYKNWLGVAILTDFASRQLCND